MLNERLSISVGEIADFCQRNHICKLSLFGSVLRDDFYADSDIDVLVEFDPEHIPGWEFVDMRDELSEIFGREVDLHTPQSLSKYFRHKVLQQAQVVYQGNKSADENNLDKNTFEKHAKSRIGIENANF